MGGAPRSTGAPAPPETDLLTLFLAGDVMLGRGVDQVFRASCDPVLHEPHVRSARVYVDLAEAESGPIPTPVEPGYVWGDALEELGQVSPDARIVNLETSVTTSDDRWKGKGIHYRMHPDNVAVLGAADIDCCVLANNHVLDWGASGLEETLETLEAAGTATAGAGMDPEAARAPAVLETGKGRRVMIFGLASATSGVPRAWSAERSRPGVNLLEDLRPDPVTALGREVETRRERGDVVVASIHWGGNWGYRVPTDRRALARRFVDEAGVDVVHGHSSHHPLGLEVHAGRLLLHGSGDFLNDYEGISGREAFRGELTLMYFPVLGPDGRLVGMEMSPMRIRRFRLERAPEEDAAWLRETLDRESRAFGARVEEGSGGRFVLRWV